MTESTRGDTPPRGEARRRPALVVVALLTACGGGDGMTREAARVAACTAETVERTPLILPSGLHAYIEPNNLMRVGDDILVVGRPSYTWEVGGDTVRMASADRYIAAYLDDEAPRLVEMPIRVSIGVVQSVALDDRRWAVLFSEADPDEGTRPIGQVVRLWYAEYDGEAWTELEQLPLPEQSLFSGWPSGLAYHQGFLHWAVARRDNEGVFHYRRRDGVWSFELLEGRSDGALSIAGGPVGLFLAVTGFDPGRPGPIKAVRLFQWDGGWQLVTSDPTLDAYTNVSFPTVIVSPDGGAVTWIEQSRGGLARARVGASLSDRGTLHTLDRSASFARPFTTTEGRLAWLVRHHGPLGGVTDLRVVHGTGDSVAVRRFISDPYTGYFAALAVGPEDVVVTGSEFSPEPSDPTVRSLTLRLSPSCE